MYKIKEKIEVEVEIVKIAKCPATDPFKTHSAVIMEDGKGNEFCWNTLTDKYPEEGGPYILKATISNNDTYTHNYELKAYHVSNCKFSKPKDN